METTLPSQGLGFLTGVISREKVNTFMLLVYRATRGNVFPKMEEIEEPIYDSNTV